MNAIAGAAQNGANNDPRLIRAIECAGAAVVVTIDGKPYAGFINRLYAEMAIGLWTGTIDGHGAPVSPFDRAPRGWLAVQGRRLEILERR